MDEKAGLFGRPIKRVPSLVRLLWRDPIILKRSFKSSRSWRQLLAPKIIIESSVEFNG